MHSRYQDLLSQFALKHKDLALATIDSIVADARFMDDFDVVGGKPSLVLPALLLAALPPWLLLLPTRRARHSRLLLSCSLLKTQGS
jgi:hypothetical protein